jgi:hypothetical protein
MKIVTIFETRLFAFHYDDEEENELERLMEKWSDVNYLYSYAKKNGISDVYGFTSNVKQDLECLEDLLLQIENGHFNLTDYFEPLGGKQFDSKILKLHKGKIPYNKLRLYGIKLADHCFVITGGAIKMSQTIQDHPDTMNELEKLLNAKKYLISNDVFDDASFYELINE